MKLLNDEESWDLFCKVVFGEDKCPLDLEGIGWKIARGCKGLPLSISVVGGLLSKTRKDDRQYWEYIAKNINSVVNLEDGEYCLRILHMSYSHLPVHLRPCFLHMGVFPEGEKIRVSELIELWVDEGFLKPIGGKSLQVVAKEYLIELVERNLIAVHTLGSIGTIKYCSIHDLLRDFCLRQARKERFENVLELHNLNTTSQERFVVSDDWSLLLEEKYDDAFRSMKLATSLFYYSWKHPPPPNSRLLRTWERCSREFCLRYHDFSNKFALINPQGNDNSSSSSSNHCFWNLKTLVMYTRMVLMEPSEFWNRPNLKHLKVLKFKLPDPPHEDGSDIVLGNLQTLSRIENFKCSEEMIKRIPNIKKLQTVYTFRFDNQEASIHFIHNIGRLRKLESFLIGFLPIPIFWQKLTFPNSLVKLTIERFWAEEILGKIGSLPFLVKLKLIGGVFGGKEWVTVEGQFRSLRFLLLKKSHKLECWKTESTHFPLLEQLILWDVGELEEIPLDIGDIPTLRLIDVKVCSASVVDSVKRIQEEQEELGNESLRVQFDRW